MGDRHIVQTGRFWSRTPISNGFALLRTSPPQRTNRVRKQANGSPFSGPVETAAHRYNEEVLVGDDGFWMVFYPIDGCDCQKRTVRIEDVDTARQRFTLSIYEKDDAGYESLLEGYEVGMGEDDKDDMGRPAYIETVFETRSSHFRCDFLEGTAWEDLGTHPALP